MTMKQTIVMKDMETKTKKKGTKISKLVTLALANSIFLLGDGSRLPKEPARYVPDEPNKYDSKKVMKYKIK